MVRKSYVSVGVTSAELFDAFAGDSTGSFEYIECTVPAADSVPQLFRTLDRKELLQTQLSIISKVEEVTAKRPLNSRAPAGTRADTRAPHSQQRRLTD